jgi:hypothetical protein
MTKRQLLSLMPIEGKVANNAECWNENEADGVNDATTDDAQDDVEKENEVLNQKLSSLIPYNHSEVRARIR